MVTSCVSEKSTIASELIQGMELARQLKFHLRSSSSSPENHLSLLQKIMSSYDTALLLLNWRESSAVQPQTVPAMVTLPESPISTNESEDLKDHHRDVSKKRWLLLRKPATFNLCVHLTLRPAFDKIYCLIISFSSIAERHYLPGKTMWEFVQIMEWKILLMMVIVGGSMDKRTFWVLPIQGKSQSHLSRDNYILLLIFIMSFCWNLHRKRPSSINLFWKKIIPQE